MRDFRNIGKVAVISLAMFSYVNLSAAVETAYKSKEHQNKEQTSVPDAVAGILSSDRQSSHKRQLTTANQLEKLAKPIDKILRDPSRVAISTSLDFDIASAYVDLIYDQDLDGYFSEFSVNFDADTNFEFADVYAEMYLSINGGPWELYHVTQVFEIQGYSYYDDYTVTTQLTEGYPPGSYDILIDLIDTYDNSWVATIGPDTEIGLEAIPLEDTTYENSVSYNSAVSIFDAQVNLLTDVDNDGFYKTFSLQFDADVESGVTDIYAEIWMRDGSGQWFLENTTEVFTLDGNSTLDTYILETTLESGYSTGYYDFKIDIFDAATDSFLNSSDEFDYALSQIPLEDAISDQYVSTTTTTLVTSTVSVESGGSGSTEWLALLTLLLGLGFRQKGIK